jgi:hypothetical protein
MQGVSNSDAVNTLVKNEMAYTSSKVIPGLRSVI